jgi:hypothetical protein
MTRGFFEDFLELGMASDFCGANKTFFAGWISCIIQQILDTLFVSIYLCLTELLLKLSGSRLSNCNGGLVSRTVRWDSHFNVGELPQERTALKDRGLSFLHSS